MVQVIMGQHKEEGCVCQISLTMGCAAGHVQNVLDNIAYFIGLLWACVFGCCTLHVTSMENDLFLFRNSPQLCVTDVFYFKLLQLQSDNLNFMGYCKEEGCVPTYLSPGSGSRLTFNLADKLAVGDFECCMLHCTSV